jgi:hypothetical protein
VRRLFSWQEPLAREVARVRSKAWASGRRWRAEVGTTLLCARPRPLGLGCGLGLSFERLVFSKVSDGQSKGVDWNQFIWDMGLENENKVRGIEIAF